MASKNIVKNITCATLGLFFISLSLLVMTKIYFQNQISSQIQNISILKDIRYPTWGQHPNPTGSELKQTFTLFSQEEIDGQIHSTRSNVSKVFQYMFQYQNTSFAQGNSGRLNFINKWELKQITDNAPSQNIKTINLAADKVYNYDFYAPPQRKFAILYNYISDVLSNSFLEKFYTVYLHQFFFQHKDLVIDTVFKPLGFSLERATQIYEHPSFGWSNVDSFQSWVVLSLKGTEEAKKMEQYQSLITDMGLTSQQIRGLTFQKSTLYNMISALNGTIKSKLMMPGATNFNYKCEKTSCTNSELVAFQIATSFLTNDPLFASLNLNMGTKQLNSTFLADIEYQRFCDKNKGKFICMQKSNMVKFFIHNYLGDFQKMDLLWKNQNNYDFIQKQFDLSNNTAQSVVKYVLNLYDNLIGKYEKVFAWSQTTYNNIEPIVKTYKNLFLVQLYSRAYFNKFINKKQVDCQKYFVGEFSEAAKIVCSEEKQETSSWNFAKYLSAIRKFMGAYLYIRNQRNKMSETLGLSFQKLIAFFNNQQISLFAKELKEIQSIFKSSFGCSKNDLELCTPQQLFCMQWGSNQIFQNLPIEIFENKIKSISQWDYQNLLKGLNPDFHAIIGKQKSVQQCMEILSSDTDNGIFSLFNIIKTAQKAFDASSNDDILKYASRNVMQVSFNGILNAQDVSSLFVGYKSDIITKKNKMDVESGGAPWLENQLKLIKTDNKAQIKNNQLLLVPQFDTIDTGIYEQNRTRQISKVWGQTRSSSKYTVYRGTKTDDDGNQIRVDIFKKYITERKVQGTNLLGFHPGIQQGENLKIFVNLAYQSMVMSYDSTVEFQSPDELKKPLKAYKYKIVLNDGENKDGSFIGIQQLNQNYFALSSESFAIVEPITGLTLEYSMEYTVKSNPIYTNFLLDSRNNIDLFSSKLSYRRKGLTQIENVINEQNLQRTLTIVAIVASSVTFVLTFVLIILYCKLRKGSKQIQQSLMQNQDIREDL